MDRRRKEIEEHIGGDTEDVDLIDPHELESNLVYFDTSLRANKMVLERLVRYSKIKSTRRIRSFWRTWWWRTSRPSR